MDILERKVEIVTETWVKIYQGSAKDVRQLVSLFSLDSSSKKLIFSKI
jgi:hypothetical protein